MLAGFDARSLYATSAFVFLGLIVSVLLAHRELRGTPGLGRFVASYCALVAGTGLFAVRDRVPDFLSIVAGNVFVVLGAALLLEGIALFYGDAVDRRVTIALSLAAAAFFSYFTWVEPSSLWRTVFSSASLAALFALAAFIAARRRPSGGPSLLDTVTAVAIGTCALLFSVRGTLVLLGRTSGDILAEDLPTALAPLVGILSAVIWTTSLLTNASRRLTRVVRAQNELMASLFQVARVASAGKGLEATLERTLDAARALIGATGSSLLLLDEHGEFTRGIFTRGETALEVRPEEARTVIAEGLAGWVARERTAALVPDVLADPRWKAIPSQGPELIRSALAAPISVGPALVGVLTLVHSRPGAFTDDQRRLLESTGAQIALVLRNAQIAEAQRRANRRQELLNEVLDVSARRAVPEEIAAGAAEAIGRALEAAVVVALPEEGGGFRRFAAGLSDAEPEAVEAALERVYAAGTTRRLPAPEGEAPASAAPIGFVVPLTHAGRVLGVLAVTRERPRAFEAADAALAEALAEAIALGLGNAELVRAREELTRSLVHDLRNPAGNLLGSLELLRAAKGLTEGDRKLVEIAERNAQRQASLIDEILELSRLEEGAVPVQPSDVSLGELVADVLRLAAPRAEAKDVPLRAAVPGDLPPVRVDRPLVARILENLVGNAIKFSPPGAGPVTVSARASGELVEVRVADSGPGVEEEVRPRLFERFASGSRSGRGAGLGLAFCRLAVEANGGRIRLERAGPGAVFAFTVPITPEGRLPG